jgi:sulfate adenylyltransferase subunit 1 (EFTu-like GTPase family)
MRIADYHELAFIELQRDFLAFAKPFGVSDPVFIPVSALRGDNVVHGSERMPWYTGPSVLEYLEGVEIDDHSIETPMRFPVQWVTRNLDLEIKPVTPSANA